MIRVNLATRSRVVSDATKMSTMTSADLPEVMNQADIQKQGLLRLVIILIGPLVLLAYQRVNIPQKVSEKVTFQNRLRELEEKNKAAKFAVEETKKYKDSEARLQKQIQTIETLRKERLNEVKLLDLIQKQIPEKLWLTKIDVKQESILFSGVSATDAELSAFMDVLSQSQLIKNVELIKSSEVQSGALIVKRFEIRSAMNSSQKAEGKK